MTLRQFILFLSCLAALGLPQRSSGCSMIVKPVVSLPPGRVVFRGVVKDHVKAPPWAIGHASFDALLVERDPRDPVSVAASLVEVRPFGFDASCHEIGSGIDELKAEFPVGTRVAVVGDLVGESTDVSIPTRCSASRPRCCSTWRTRSRARSSC